MKLAYYSSLLFVFILSAHLGFSQAPLVKQWDKSFGGNKYESMLFSFLATTDGGYLLGCTTGSDSGFDVSQPPRGSNGKYSDYWIVKTDSLGNKQWDKRFGGNNGQSLKNMAIAKDGGYILVGTTYSDSGADVSQPSRDSGYNDYWIVKIDAQGNKQWDKRYGGNLYDESFDVLPTEDGGYLVGGHSGSWSGDVSVPSVYADEIWLLKIDAAGNKQWDKSFRGNVSEILFSIAATTDGNYILGGVTSSDRGYDVSEPAKAPGLEYDFWVIKIDPSGKKLWDKRYGGALQEYLYTVIPTADNGFLLAGGARSDSGQDFSQPKGLHDSTDYWLVKIDANGSKQWDRRYGGKGHDYIMNTVLTRDGGFLMTGVTSSNKGSEKTEDNILAQQQPWLVKIDYKGDVLWDKTINVANVGEGMPLPLGRQTADGGIAVCVQTTAGIGGDKTADSTGRTDLWLIKFGDTSPYTPDTTCQAKFTLYPDAGTPHRWYALNQSSGANISSYNWSWGDGGLATGAYPSHTYADTGTYNICLTVKNMTGCISTYCNDTTLLHKTEATMVSINVVDQLPVATGVTETTDGKINILLRPNPTTGTLFIQTNGFFPATTTVYTLQGQKLSEEKYHSTTDVSALPAGIYFIELRDGANVLRKRFVKE